MLLRITPLIFFLLTTRLAFSQCTVPQKDFFVPDGQGGIFSVVNTGDTLYMAGRFTSIARYTGGICQINKTSSTTASPMPKVSGTVKTIVADGSGGWYIGGSFTSVNDVKRENFAHITSNGEVGTFDANPDGEVSSIVVTGSRVFIAGSFTRVATRSSLNRYLAAFDTNGTLLGWNPDVNDVVRKIDMVDGKLIVGGDFTSINGFSRVCLAKIDTATALPETWAAGIGNNVYDFVVDDSLIYVGGYFTTVSGSSRTKVAAVRLSNGSLYTPFNVTVPTSTFMYSLAVSGGNLFLGGDFITINGSSRRCFASVNKLTGALNPMSINLGNKVNVVKTIDNDIYIGGDFLTVNGNSDRKHLIRVDAQSGAISDWDPLLTDEVFAIAGSGNSVMLGGDFKGYHRIKRNNFAAANLSTSQLLDWAPRASGSPSIAHYVNELHLVNNKIIAAGNFDSINGTLRKRLAMIDLEGNLMAWNPEPNGEVTSIESYNGVVYLAGLFTNIGGLARRNFALVSETLGNVLSYSITHTGSINKLKVYNGSLYLGGKFSALNGVNRSQLAKFNIAGDAANPVIVNWNPSLMGTSSLDAVHNIKAAFGRIYVTYTDYQTSSLSYASIAYVDTLASYYTVFDRYSITSSAYAESGGIAFDSTSLYYSFAYGVSAYTGFVKRASPTGDVDMSFGELSTTARLAVAGNRLVVHGYGGPINEHYLQSMAVFNLASRPEITVSKPLGKICENDTLVFTSSSPVDNRWSSSNGSGYDQQFTIKKISDNNAYTVTLRAPVSDCPLATNSVTFRVNTKPTLLFDDNTIQACRESGTDIRAYANDPVSYLWSTGDTDSLIHTNVAGVYTVTVTDAFGCTNSGKVTVNLRSTTAAPVITSSTGKFTVCGNDSLQLKSGWAYTYWLHGPATNEITAGAGNYAVYIKNGGLTGCNSDTAYITITGLERPAKPVILKSKSALCGTDSLLLSVDVPNADSLVWSNGINGEKENKILQPGKYYVEHHNSGCNSVSDTITIKNNKAATPVVTANRSTSFCEGGSVILTSSHTGTNMWNNGATTKSITVTTDGGYKVVAVVEACNSDSSDRVTVTVNPLPPTPVIAFAPDSAVIISNSLTGNQWYRNNGMINGAVSFQYAPAQAGTYHTIVTNTFGCKSAKSNEVVLLSTGLNIIGNSGRQVSVYPNPTQGFVYFDETVNMINVFNMEGRLAKEEPQTGIVGKKQVDLTAYPDGMYLLQMTDEEGNQYYARIVKN